MKTAVFSTKSYDREFLLAANVAAGNRHEFEFFEERLNHHTAPLAKGFPVVSAFVNDCLDARVIDGLAEDGTQWIALRCAGYNNVDITHAAGRGIRTARVPAYSPFAVAEHATALILALNRKTHRAYNRVREGNFSIEGLMGFDLNGKTVGIIGTGKIGVIHAGIMAGFGCKLVAFDPCENPDFLALGGRYTSLDELFAESDVICLHCPLSQQTHHLINEAAIARMKRGVMIINTSRGALVDAAGMIEGIKSGQIGALGLDVYEHEHDFFYQDLSDEILSDDVLARLCTFSNVLVTAHQAYFTDTALRNIAETTIQNLDDFKAGGPLRNEVSARH